MNKRGFTLIEVMIATGITLAIFYLIIGFPTALMKLYKTMDVDSDYYHSMTNISTAINNDMRNSSTIDNITENTFRIGDSEYRIDGDGLYRQNVKISGMKLNFSFQNNMLKIYSLAPDKNNNSLDLFFYFSPRFTEY